MNCEQRNEIGEFWNASESREFYVEQGCAVGIKMAVDRMWAALKECIRLGALTSRGSIPTLDEADDLRRETKISELELVIDDAS